MVKARQMEEKGYQRNHIAQSLGVSGKTITNWLGPKKVCTVDTPMKVEYALKDTPMQTVDE